MSIAHIVTRGFGSFGSISKVVTRGFSIASESVILKSINLDGFQRKSINLDGFQRNLINLTGYIKK